MRVTVDPRRVLRATGLMAALVMPLPLAVPAALQAQQSVVLRSRADGWLGLSVEEKIAIDRQGARTGITVLRVVDGGPSERAGLRPGDRVIEVNGRPALPALFNRIASGLAPGQSMRLVVQRDDDAPQELVVTAAPHPASPAVFLTREMAAAVDSKLRRLDSLRVTLSHRGGTVTGVVAGPGTRIHEMVLPGVDSAAVTFRVDSVSARRLLRPTGGTAGSRSEWRAAFDDEAPSPLLPYVEGLHWVGGARFTPLNDDLAAYFDVEGGLLVTDVIGGTLLPEAGLRPGDVVTAVDGRRVQTLDPFRAAVSERNRRTVVLSVVRHGEPVSVRLTGGGR